MTAVESLVGLVGVTIIITDGTIFRRVRALWPAFLGCPLCVGFWVGLSAHVREHFGREWDPITSVMYGALVGLVSLLVEAWIVDKLGEKEGP